ncbi:hypothetical protein [Phyllobacterium chamaecytisi]|uniref:hypothetical protein n=1 Tax=Phyllobacterium chamaecytisi TaxID=2876082 RepID=UPI001CC9FA75|nr:hypothetical protein [Phyllobacterium sp. KW56]MBZ9603347.1 hypothetical protein [Phyllobacterium sp. KW56]
MQDILEAQRQMQIEADQVVCMLNLNELLSELGDPSRVGSSAMGLMVRRDIDITVACPRLDEDAFAGFAEIGAKLMQRADCVVATRFRNDTGRWNTEPEKYPDGLYLWLSVMMPDGAKWTIDIWLVDKPERQPDLAHLRTLLPRLSDADRSIILQIKHVLAESKISSALVYEAVMDHGVRTVAEFERWHRDCQ